MLTLEALKLLLVGGAAVSGMGFGIAKWMVPNIVMSSKEETKKLKPLEIELPSCKVWETDIPKSSRITTTKEIKDKKAFFTNPSISSDFRKEIINACIGKDNKKNWKDNVFIYNNGSKWVYSSALQKDWISDNGVAKS